MKFNLFSINRLQDFLGGISVLRLREVGKIFPKREDGGFDNILPIYFVFVVFYYLALQKRPGRNYFCS